MAASDKQRITFRMSDALIKSCKQVAAIQKSTPLKTERASRGVLRLAQENLDRLEQ